MTPSTASSAVVDTFPLAPVQQGIVFQCAIFDPRAYVAQFACRLTGDLRPDLFKQAWQRVLQRHEILRAGIHLADSMEAVHAVHADVQPEWTDAALDDGSPIDAQLESLRRAERDRGFELARPPLTRFLLIRSASDEHWFVWTWHHVIADGWSTMVILEEVAAIYVGLVNGRDVILPPAVSFRHYVEWLRAASGDGSAAFWRRHLQDAPRTTLVRGGEGRRHRSSRSTDVRLSEAETMALSRFAREHDLTLASVCYACWALLLARFTGRHDIVFGMTVSGRDAPIDGIGRMVGPTINTLPVRQRVPLDTPLLEWLEAFQQELAELRAHGHASLSEILQQAGLTEEPFDTLVVIENFSRAARETRGAPLRMSDVDGTVLTHYPMTVAVVLEPRVDIRLTCDEATADAAHVDRIAASLRVLVTSLPGCKDRPVRDIPYLPEPESVLANQPVTVVYPARSIVALVEAQVDRTPDFVAVRTRAGALTYAELDASANQLARYLRRLGVGPETAVAVSLDRGQDLVTVLLAVLKTGAAYLPLDTAYPLERRRQLVRESNARIVLGRQPVAGASAGYVDLDEIGDEVAHESPARLRPAIAADNVAYILYTSGSTGTPKGVALTHANAANLLQWAVDYFGAARLRRVAAVSSYCFDLSIFEMFGPLSCGGETVIADSAADLETLRAASPLTLLNTVPSAMTLLRDAGAGPGLTEAVSLAGEALTGSTAAMVVEMLAPAELFNLYGPSETTTYSVAHRLAASDAIASAARVPIGRPIANTRVYVLDEAGDPVPVGGEGELFIAGAGVGRGYWNRPDLTAARFLPDAYGLPGSRCYRTGDLVRRRTEDVLEFVGRADNQVKVRGYRVELGEIETAMARHPRVHESAAWVAQTALGAVLVAAWTGPADPGAVREWLSDRLPRYMVPNQLVGLPALPRLPNGKLDRRSLAELVSASSDPLLAVRAARDPLETAVLEIWEQVLGRPVSRTDSFLTAGGHSLHAMQVVSRVAAVLGASVPLRALFEASSAAAFSARVAAALSGREAERIVAVGRSAPIVASPAQQRLWFLEQLASGTGLYNVSLAVRIHGALDVDALGAAFDRIVERHEVLRTTFHVTGDGKVLQHIASTGRPSFEVRAGDEAAAQRWARAEAGRGFDLTSGPLLRAVLVSVESDSWILILTFHHIVVDAWSLQILWRELNIFYQAAVAGSAADLPPLPVQYADYAAWQDQALASGASRGSLQYWTKQLSGVPPLDLPLDRPRPAVQTFNGGRRSRILAADVSTAVRALARQSNATLFMVMAGAVQVLLSRSSDQRDFAIGIPAISRPSPDLDDVVGPFLNTLVLRADLSGAPSFVDLLGRVRRTVLDAYTHADAPFERLIDEVGIKRDTSRHPLFQVMFVFEQWDGTPPAAPGLTVQRLDSAAGLAKFDMTLYVNAAGDEIGLSVEYNRDLFDDGTVERYLWRWEALLHAILRTPNAAVQDLPWLDDADRREIARTNEVDVEHDVRPLPSIVEEQVGRTPDAIAIVDGDRALTYAQLNARANQLARHLRALGAAPEVRVGLAVDRSADSIVALLAIWKCGAAYVPLDLEHPPERLKTMLSDARPALLVTTGSARSRLPNHGLRTVCLDAAGPSVDLQPTGDLGVRIDPDNLAYVIYSSGSTGKPKGIALPHRCLSNLIAWHGRVVPRGATVLQFASLGFDGSVHEAFAAFATGATLVIADEGVRRDPYRLAAFLAERQLEKIELPVVMLQRTAEAAVAGGLELPALRVVTATGEQLRVTDAVRQWFGGMQAELRNHYGPSETHLATALVLPRQPSAWNDTPSIGRPIDNTTVYVLDGRLNQVPLGIPGELYIGGVVLARGYWDRADQTAERFVPNPFAGAFGERLYRTGDLVRLLPSGEIEFLGRLDHQVKIRGYRIEPAEIEAELEAHPAIGRALVVARELDGARQLVAYVVRQREVSAHALKNHLRERLPSFMIPAHWMFIDDVPVNANGKVDYRALPSPDRAARDPSVRLRPRSVTEARLEWLWQDVLRRPAIGVRDDFFELGGESISAAVLIRRVREVFGREIPVTALFQAPTIEELARLLQEPDRGWGGVLSPIQMEGDRPRFYCVHPVGGGVVCYATFARALRGTCRFYGLQAPGWNGEGEPLRTIGGLAETYVRALLRDAGDEPILLGGWSLGGKIAYEMARQLEAAGRPPRLLAMFDTAARRPPRQTPDQAALLAEMLKGRLDVSVDRLRALPSDEQLRQVLHAAHQAGVITDDVGTREAQRAIDIYRANLEADASYAIEPYGGTVTLFRAAEPVDDGSDESLGWRAVARGVRVHVCPGTHLTMIEDPLRAAELARALDICIAEALS